MLNFSSIARRAPALALAATLLTSGVGPAPTPTLAADLQPAGRLNVIMKSVKVLDANEGWGDDDGEFKLDFRLVRCHEGIAAPCLGPDGNHIGESEELSGLQETFGATEGKPKAVERILAAEPGFDILPGRQYVIRFEMWEKDDTTGDDYMGRVLHTVDAGANGFAIGEHTERASSRNGSHDGDFLVTYEIVQAGLPDLQPVSIKVEDIVGSAQKRVCMGVKNVGVIDSGPFNVTLTVGRTSPPNGTAVGTGLGVGQTTDLCTNVDLPVSGDHELSTIVDISKTVAEMNDNNNSFTQPYSAKAAAAIDLTVGDVKINGRVPDGKDDCKDGKNAVTVIVKNAGTTNADAFAVQLAVDNPQGNLERSVTGLEAGKEVEVRFEDAKLKKGDRTLTVTVDSKGAVTESNEDNNERKVTAQCTDDH